jgi:hypothetical protein
MSSRTWKIPDISILRVEGLQHYFGRCGFGTVARTRCSTALMRAYHLTPRVPSRVRLNSLSLQSVGSWYGCSWSLEPLSVPTISGRADPAGCAPICRVIPYTLIHSRDLTAPLSLALTLSGFLVVTQTRITCKNLVECPDGLSLLEFPAPGLSAAVVLNSGVEDQPEQRPLMIPCH